jgi:transposase
MPKTYIGVDIAKSTFAVCAIDEDGRVLFQETRLPQSRHGFERLLQLLEKTSGDVLVGMESTSTYQLPLIAFLAEQEIATVVLNPSLVNKFAKLDLRPTKTDKKDARLIAEFLRQRQPKPQSGTGWSEVQLLSRNRDRLIVACSALKVNIHQALAVLFPELEEAGINPFTDGMRRFLPAYPSAQRICQAPIEEVRHAFQAAFHGRAGRNAHFSAEYLFQLAGRSIGIVSPAQEHLLVEYLEELCFLEKRRERCDDLLEQAVQKIETQALEILTSVPGIGETTARTFLAEAGDIHRFDGAGKLVAFAGLDPSIRQSGTMLRQGRISKRGNKRLRRVLYIMAQGVVRYEASLRGYYQKLRERGKAYQVAIIAVANKLVHMLYAMLIKGTSYVPPKVASEGIADS